MRRLGLGLILGMMGLMLPSCFNIKEEITLKKNGSGNYEMVFDLGEMMSMLSMLSEGEEGASMDSAMAEFDNEMVEMREKLTGMDGIANVSTRREEGKIFLSYDFASLEALNQATGQGTPAMMEELGGSTSSGKDTYGMANKKTFSRAGLPADPKDLMGDMDEEQMGFMKMFMQDANYTTIYHLPRKVKKMSNEDAELSSDKRTVTLKVNFMDLMEGNGDLGNTIKMK